MSVGRCRTQQCVQCTPYIYLYAVRYRSNILALVRVFFCCLAFCVNDCSEKLSTLLLLLVLCPFGWCCLIFKWFFMFVSMRFSLSLSVCISAQLLRFRLVCRAAKIHKTMPYLDSWIWDRSYFNFNVQYNLIAKAILDADATSFAPTFCNSSLLEPEKYSNFSIVTQESWEKKIISTFATLNNIEYNILFPSSMNTKKALLRSFRLLRMGSHTFCGIGTVYIGVYKRIL